MVAGAREMVSAFEQLGQTVRGRISYAVIDVHYLSWSAVGLLAGGTYKSGAC